MNGQFAGMPGESPEEGHVDTVAGWYLMFSFGMFGLAMAIDLRCRAGHLAAPLYVIGTALILAAMTLIARFGPTTDWVGWRICPRMTLSRSRIQPSPRGPLEPRWTIYVVPREPGGTLVGRRQWSPFGHCVFAVDRPHFLR